MGKVWCVYIVGRGTCEYPLRRRCKFGEYCYFDHKETDSELLHKKVNDITVKVDNLEKKLEDKQNNQQTSNSDFETLEKRLERLEVLIEEKNRRIEVLEEKMKVIELKHVEKSKINHEKSSLVCKCCPFEAKSVSGLKVHMKRKHTFKDIDTYPTHCEICNDIIENGLKMKRHMKDHSYICATYKCLDCNFICDNDSEMEVHIGKDHGEGFECYLCGLIAESSEKLETHLLTCEVYDCGSCDERTKTLENIKQHIRESHQKYLEFNIIRHLKLSTENFSEIKKKEYYYKEV